MTDWSLYETSKHQDHVIAHVMGATVLALFVADETAHLLLDIGFIWAIYLDGGIGLLPQSGAVSELGLDEKIKAELLSDISLMQAEGRVAASALKRFLASPTDCLIGEVSLYAYGERRRILLSGESGGIIIETSLATREISFRAASDGP